MSKEMGWEFGPEFQEKMLALMVQDLGFAMKAADYVPEDRLYSDAHKYIFTKFRESLTTTSEIPSFISIEDQLKKMDVAKRRLFKTFVKRIYEIKVSISEAVFIKEKLTDYGKKNVFVDVFQTAQTLWNSKRHEDAYNYTMEGIAKLFAVNFQDDAGIGIEKFEDERQIHIFKSEKTVRRIPTLIEPLDLMLRGGLEKGELGILLAQPKRGKSIGLVHMGSAALMMRFGSVAHFVLEGTTEQTIMRYQSRLSGIEYSRLEKDEITTDEIHRLERVGSKYQSKLHLIPFNKHWEYTVQDVEAKIRELSRFGRKPDLIIIDYADLLKSHKSRESFRLEQAEVFRDLKTLAMMHNVAIWTACQAQRPSDDPDKVTLLRARDIAEAFEKVRIADLVITLNQTPREKDYGILRFHIDIYRSNDADKTIRLITNFEKMIFFSKRLGFVGNEDVPSWMEKKKKS